MKQEKLFQKPILANILLFVIYAAIVCVTAAHHEPWRDEADTWLCTRDESLSTILSRTGYMGTPGLWYVVVFPLAKLGLPYGSMMLLTVVIALLSVALIVFRSPFGFWLRASICFSYLFIYEYSVIARSYGLSVLLIMSLAALSNRRQYHPLLYGLLIALLANTNVHGLIVAIALTSSLLLTGWKKTRLSALAPMLLVAALGVGASVLQLLPPSDGQLPAGLSSEWYKQPVLSTFKGAFFPDLALSISRGYSAPSLGGVFGLALKLMSFGIIILILKKIWSNKFALLTFLLSYGALFALFVFKYYGSVRHWGFYVLVAIFCLWVQAEENRSEATVPMKKFDLVFSVLIFLTFAYSSAIGLYACAIDIKQPFSSGEAIARQLKQLNTSDAPVVCAPNTGLSVLPYLPGLRFFYPNLNEFGTHAMWNRAEKQVLAMPQVCEIIDARFGRAKKLFLVTDEESPELLQQGFKCVYRSEVPPISTSENFVLYARN